MNLEERQCTLCRGTAQKVVRYPANFDSGHLNAEVFSARRRPDRRHFRLMECAGCGIIFSDPACDPRQLAQLYEESAVTYGVLEEQVFASYAPILDRALRRLTAREQFVELGGGSGFMLRYGMRHGFREMIEVEPSADAEKRFDGTMPGSRFVRGMFQEGVLEAGRANLVCFFQMLDHVPDPLQFVQNVERALAPEGVAVCVTHNTQALSAKVLGERSPIYDIEHTYLFNQNNLAQLFERAGFESVEAFPVANAYSLEYWLHLAPLPAGLKRGSEKLLRALRLDQVRARLRAGNIAVIASKKKPSVSERESRRQDHAHERAPAHVAPKSDFSYVTLQRRA